MSNPTQKKDWGGIHFQFIKETGAVFITNVYYYTNSEGPVVAHMRSYGMYPREPFRSFVESWTQACAPILLSRWTRETDQTVEFYMCFHGGLGPNVAHFQGPWKVDLIE